MNFKKLIFIAAVFSTLPLTALAETWSKQYEIEYILGDSDSKKTAREMAIDLLRVKAANESGVYVETKDTLTGDDLKETIKTISASIIKISNVREDYSQQGKNLILHLTATAEISESELKRRVEAMNNDQQKLNKINQLSKNNKALTLELERLIKQLNSPDASPAQKKQLRASQEKLISDIRNSESEISSEFETGSLVTALNASNNRLKAQKDEMETLVFNPLLAVKINASVIDVRETPNGLLEAKIKLNWAMPIEQADVAWHALSRYFNITQVGATQGTYVGQRNINDQLFDHVAATQTNIHVSMGSSSKKIPIFWAEPRGYQLNCRGVARSKRSGGEESIICINTKDTATITLQLKKAEIDQIDKIQTTVNKSSEI